MSRTTRKALFYGLLLVAGITFGMQLAETGTNRIYNPVSAVSGRQYDQVDEETGRVQADREGLWERRPQENEPPRAAAPPLETPERLQTPDSLLLPEPEQAPVDRFADKAANLLQQVSQRSIYWVASLFNSGD
ncbi:hypothetical protein [Paenibacillus woosongensis]|uniref:Uncharacterized protein n=1 Tax=Paenibacillus woosongensis TaxID=307580 RepID=A0A7X2Z095_9BACL|nr:hypothetical protein [Paenibacillus woosongensis]MUG45097.1 hypothetical protein [Paenibacillus woosongensis]